MYLCEPGLENRETAEPRGFGHDPDPCRERTYCLPGEKEGLPAPGLAALYALPEGLPEAPPEYIPSITSAVSKNVVNSWAASGCVGRHTYIWLKNGAGFWLYPTYSGKRSLSGYRWTLRGWTFTGVILDWIDFFQCV